MSRKNRILTGPSSARSPSSRVLLREQLRLEELQDWLEFRKSVLDERRTIDRGLVCVYCSEPELLEEATTRAELKFLATLDHVRPLSKGGERLSRENVVVACHPCNHRKADTWSESWKLKSTST